MTETFSLSCAISDRVGEWEDCQFFHKNESYCIQCWASYTQILKRISEGYWFMSRYIGHRYIWEGNWFGIDILEVWHCWTWDQLRSLAQARSCYCSTCQSLSRVIFCYMKVAYVIFCSMFCYTNVLALDLCKRTWSEMTPPFPFDGDLEPEQIN